jgi:hypothetical protein
MTASSAPDVLLVDDTDELRPLAKLVEVAASARCRVMAPSDVSEEDLRSADLVLVDYVLDEWLNSISHEPIAVCPPNGIALASLFRQYSDQKTPPTGYALITGKGEGLGLLPAERRPHVISRLNNLEWYFEKRADQSKTTQQIVSLATAVRSLPTNVKSDLASGEALVRFLGVVDADPLFDRYCDAVMRCRPPLHHLSEQSHGLVIIRWLLHRILPHTCFLLDTLHLAGRLRVSPDSLEQCLVDKGSFVRELEPLTYRGPLASFDRPRWWRDGVEQWLWDRTNGESADDTAVLNYLRSLGTAQLVEVGIANPVVTVDHELREERRLASYQDVVSLRLDDWPDYAEPAYATKATLEAHPEMKAFVANC